MDKDNHEKLESLLRKRLAAHQGQAKTLGTCPDENVVAAYLEKTLPLAMSQAFETHASQCSHCQRELALLLRSGEEVTLSPAHQPVSTIPWFQRLIPQWTAIPAWSWSLKPALAVIVVAVVSTFVGYEVYLRRDSSQLPDGRENLEMKPLGKASPPLAQSNEPAPESETRSKIVSSENSDKGAPLRGPTSDRPSLDSRQREAEFAAPSSEPLSDSLARKEKSAGILGKDVSSTAENEPRATAVRDLEEKDEMAGGVTTSTVESPAISALPGKAPAPVAALKSSSAIPSSEATANRTNKLERKPAEGQVSSTQGQEISRPDGMRVGGVVASEEKKQPASEKESQSTQKSKSQAYRLAVADSRGMRLEVADKVFKLQGNTWTDLSISQGKKDEKITVIHRSAPDYDKQIAPLRSYERVLSLPEDCLIQYQGRIYRITGHPKDPPDSVDTDSVDH